MRLSEATLEMLMHMGDPIAALALYYMDGLHTGAFTCAGHIWVSSLR